MVKQQQPLFNHQLRRNRQLCTVRLDAQGHPEVVYARDVDFAHTPQLYGLFVSQRAGWGGDCLCTFNTYELGRKILCFTKG
jgi:hypothetical protein